MAKTLLQRDVTAANNKLRQARAALLRAENVLAGMHAEVAKPIDAASELLTAIDARTGRRDPSKRAKKK